MGTQRSRPVRLLTSPGLWIPLAAALPVLWALLPGGMPNTADGLVHYTRSIEMVHAWQDGVLLPRWAENLGLGYGIPLFVYAPPLPYLLTAAAHTLLGLPLDVAYKAMMVVALLAAAYGAYRLGASLLGVWAGAVSATAFLYAPIMLRELFIQGNIAQYLAWAFAPWVAWAVIRIYAATAMRSRAGYALVLACAVMGTLLSHNAAALLVAGMSAGLAAVVLLTTREARGLAASLGGLLLGLALSAWFWVPALFEGKYVALDRIVASDFRPRFIAVNELVALSPRLDTGAINPYYPLTLGAVQVWLGIGGAILFLAALVADLLRPQAPDPSSARTNRVLLGAGIFFIAFTAFCAFMATAYSEPVWSALPFVALFEWPFRWHGFAAVGLAWLSAHTIFFARRLHRHAEEIAAIAALAMLMGSALVNLYPHRLAPGRPFSPAEVVRFESKTGAVGTTSLGEFNPIWVEEPFKTSPLVEDYRTGLPIDRLKHNLPAGASGEQTYSSVHRQEFRVSLPDPATLTLSLLYFPGWGAQIDGVPAAVRPQETSGLLEVDMPAGDHTLALTFAGTPVRRAAAMVSILAWVALAAVAVVLVRPLGSDSKPEQEGVPPVWPPILGTAAVSAIMILLAATLPNQFRLHSPPDRAYPADMPLHVDFSDQLRLLGVDALPQSTRAGATITLAGYFRALQDVDEDYAVFLHLDDPISGETIATVDESHPGDIPTSDWATGLYVRSPLKLTIPEDADPIQYALRLGFTDPRTGGLLSLTDGSADTYEVGRLWVDDVPRPRPPAGPNARFGDHIELLGATVADDEIALYWRTDARLPRDYSVFVHLLNADGVRMAQHDGAPYQNRYPTSAWRPGSVIEDRRLLTGLLPDGADLHEVAVGLYDPVTGDRLPALDDDGSPLPDKALTIPAQSD